MYLYDFCFNAYDYVTHTPYNRLKKHRLKLYKLTFDCIYSKRNGNGGYLYHGDK